VATDIHVQQVIHIASVDNDKCDRLSRRGSNSTVSVAEEAPIGVVGTVEVNREDSIMGVLRLCDPRRKMATESEFVAFWSEFRGAIANFLHCHAQPPQQPTTENAHGI
jgi:hypothetical protein